MDALTERQTKLLDFIIRQYVKTAEPVGSELVSQESNFHVSPATIRNEMVALDEKGYLTQPHTSAGRIPTDKAYRHFVNDMLAKKDKVLDQKSKNTIDQALAGSKQDPQSINRTIADLLRDLSDNLVVTTSDKRKDLYKTGLSNLFEFPEFREINRVFQVTEFFDHFDSMFDQIERQFFGQPPPAGGEPQSLRVFIGRENPVRNIQDEAMIVGRYTLPNSKSGSITVIGPKRMNYGRNIALVRYTVSKLNEMNE